MGKFVGLVGAVTTFGAVAYLMAPLPPHAPSEAVRLAGTNPSDAQSSPQALRVATARPARETVARRPAAAPPRIEPTIALVQQIQSELHRLGCYSGAIDGQWSGETQRAMQTLGERVSVLRPVETPDYIMLALARSQTSNVCTPKQRTASARTGTKWTAIAAPEIANSDSGRSAGEMKPTSGKTRVAAAPPVGSPDRSQTASRRATTAPKRPVAGDTISSADAALMKAARDELDRIEARERLATNRALTATAPADETGTVARPTSEPSRMGLGARAPDPLTAGIDPRDPNAPAILRGPSQPPPRDTARDDTSPPSLAGRPAQKPHRPPTSSVASKAPPTAKQAKRAWMRTVFAKMRFDGP